MTDPTLTDEARHDRACQQAQADAERNRPYDIDQEELRIWAEILQGKHDADMAQSESFDMANVMRIAYQASRLRDVLDGCVMTNLAGPQHRKYDNQLTGQDVGPLRDFDVQMADYVHQEAIRRVDR